MEIKLQRFGAAANPEKKYIHRPGVYAILPLADGILTTFQAGIHNEYQLPGGGVDPGEQPIQALHREVLEETGWRIMRPRVFFRFKRFVFMPEYDLWAEKICTIYTAQPVMRRSAPIEQNHFPIVLNVEEALSLLAVSGDRYAVSLFF